MKVFLMYLLVFLGISVSAENSELVRIQSHLRLVETLLKQNTPLDLSEEQTFNRKNLLLELNQYWRTGIFPTNSHHPDRRQPYFIDHQGVACAVAHLMISSGHNQLAQRISSYDNYSYLDEINFPEILEWANTQGFTLEELRLIQPAYGYKKKYQDPLFEAAFLLDFEKVKQILNERWPLAKKSQEKKRYLQDLSFALRLAATNANWDKKANDKTKIKRRRKKIFTRPPARKSNGKELVQYLLELGADPNITENPPWGKFSNSDKTPVHVFATSVYLTKDKEIRQLLQNHGGQLTQQEQFLDAIESKDLATINQLLAKKDFSPYGKQNALSGPVTFTAERYVDEINPSGDFKKWAAMQRCKPKDSVYWDIVWSMITVHFKKIKWERERTGYGPLITLLARECQFGRIKEILKANSFKISNNDLRLFTYSYTGSVIHDHIAHSKKADEVFIDVLKRAKLGDVELNILDRVYGFALRRGKKELLNKLKKIDGRLTRKGSNILAMRIFNMGKISENDWQVLRMMVNEGAKINTHIRDTYPLRIAIEKKNLDLVNFLLKAGADPNFDSQHGCRPLALAVSLSQPRIVKTLLKSKADPNIKFQPKNKKCFPATNKNTTSEPIPIKKMEMSTQIRKLFK